jgi:hypothetical protein
MVEHPRLIQIWFNGREWRLAPMLVNMILEVVAPDGCVESCAGLWRLTARP